MDYARFKISILFSWYFRVKRVTRRGFWMPCFITLKTRKNTVNSYKTKNLYLPCLEWYMNKLHCKNPQNIKYGNKTEKCCLCKWCCVWEKSNSEKMVFKDMFFTHFFFSSDLRDDMLWKQKKAKISKSISVLNNVSSVHTFTGFFVNRV